MRSTGRTVGANVAGLGSPCAFAAGSPSSGALARPPDLPRRERLDRLRLRQPPHVRRPPRSPRRPPGPRHRGQQPGPRRAFAPSTASSSTCACASTTPPPRARTCAPSPGASPSAPRPRRQNTRSSSPWTATPGRSPLYRNTVDDADQQPGRPRRHARRGDVSLRHPRSHLADRRDELPLRRRPATISSTWPCPGPRSPRWGCSPTGRWWCGPRRRAAPTASTETSPVTTPSAPAPSPTSTGPAPTAPAAPARPAPPLAAPADPGDRAALVDPVDRRAQEGPPPATPAGRAA